MQQASRPAREKSPYAPGRTAGGGGEMPVALPGPGRGPASQEGADGPHGRSLERDDERDEHQEGSEQGALHVGEDLGVGAKLVEGGPLVADLAVDDAPDGDAAHRDGGAGRGQAAIAAVGVRAAEGPNGGD